MAIDSVTEYGGKRYIGYIENGVNIDHIPHGNAWYVMKILNLFNSDSQTGVGINLPSHKIGLKDLVKIENRILTSNEIDAISLFCIGSTLSVIKDFVVIDKRILDFPEQINDIIICPNNRCVSHQHTSLFTSCVNHKGVMVIKCHYCEQVYMLDDIKQYRF